MVKECFVVPAVLFYLGVVLKQVLVCPQYFPPPPPSQNPVSSRFSLAFIMVKECFVVPAIILPLARKVNKRYFSFGEENLVAP
jgi:hypothetical protein